MKGKKNHPELEVEKLVPVLTYLPQDQHEDLKRRAKKELRTISAMARILLVERLAEKAHK